MSLDYDGRNAPRWHDLTPDERTAATFQTVAVGIGDVTGANADEYVARVRLLERMGLGMLLKDDGNGGSVSAWTDERLAWVTGLRTNVFPTESRESFLARHTRFLLDDDARKARETRTGLLGPDAEPTADQAAQTKALRSVLDEREAREVVTRYALDVARRAGLDLSVHDLDVDYMSVDVVVRAVRTAITEALAEQAEAEDEDEDGHTEGCEEGCQRSHL